jgi:hypothetical protein
MTSEGKARSHRRLAPRLLIGGILAASMAVVLPATGLTAAGWAILASPSLPQNAAMNAVTCVSSTECWAVGDYVLGGVDQTLIEEWNGTTWAVVSSPNTSASQQNTLLGVACASASTCFAVGQGNGNSLIEDWSGTAWTIDGASGMPIAGLSSVTCESATLCFAVGVQGKLSGLVLYDQTLVFRWVGSNWTTGVAANTSTTQNNRLFGVACSTASQCWATGYYSNGSVNQTLIETWTGGNWTIVASPNTSTGTANELFGLACAAATECWGVGTAGGQTLVVEWAGTAWAIVTSPNAGSGDSLAGVTCFATSECWAAGSYVSAGVNQTLVEEWTGTAWSVVSSPNTGATQANSLAGIACAAASDCSAVGSYVGANGFQQALAEHFNGTWSITGSPALTDTQTNLLSGVTCLSASDCLAVGSAVDGAQDQTLAASWNGSAWSTVATSNLFGNNGTLDSVACISATNCFAAGYSTEGLLSQNLIKSWNGTSWSNVSSPDQGTGSNNLNGVACSGPTSCMAVGSYISSGVAQTLIESWNGTTWSIVTSPDLSTHENILNGVACTSSSSCVAAGYYQNSSGTIVTLIETWNGSAWTAATSPNVASSSNSLTAVSCTTSTSCTAVGSSTGGSGITDTLIEGLSGTTWSIVASPDPGTILNALSGVSCPSATSCTAVGEYLNSSSVDQTLVESWSGSVWSLTSSPNQGAGNNTLNGVACISATTCEAVGDYFNSSNVEQTLVEQNATAPTSYQDSNVVVAYDGWIGVTDSSANGGTYRTSAKKSAKVTFKFTGTAITWVTRKGPDQGIASVKIDGTSKGNVDLYASSAQGFSQSFSGLASKSHTIIITVTGTKNASSTGTGVALDAFVVGTTTTQDSANAITYDSWTGATSSSASGGTYRIDGSKNATSTLTFSGTGVNWITSTGPSYGQANVSIDGVSKGTVDLYASTVHWQVVEAYTGLASGSHTIVITVLGTKNASSKGTKVVVDAFVAQP